MSSGSAYMVLQVLITVYRKLQLRTTDHD